jgi:PIN domain nuclease of toxin-antitoxin system
VKILLDTHALLWFLLNDARLSAYAKAIIADSNNDALISPASYWEIAIKISIGKYVLTKPFTEFMEQELAKNKLAILPISIKHAGIVCTLPFHHRDPFDRLMIAQAMAEDIPIISNDINFDKYPVSRKW